MNDLYEKAVLNFGKEYVDKRVNNVLRTLADPIQTAKENVERAVLSSKGGRPIEMMKHYQIMFDDFQMSYASFNAYLRQMVNSGLIIKTGRGQYVIPS